MASEGEGAGAVGGDNGKPNGRRNSQQEFLEALEKNDLERFRQLLPQVNPQFKYKRDRLRSTCLEIASRRKWGAEFVKALLTRMKPNLNATVMEPVHHAAKYGNDEVLAALLADRRTIAAAVDVKGRTALHYVCTCVTPWNVEGYKKCVELLMFHFSPDDINRTDKRGFTAVHAAARFQPKKRLPIRLEESQEGTDRENDQEEQIWRSRQNVLQRMFEIGQDVLDLDTSRALGHSPRESILMSFPELRDSLPRRMELWQSDPHVALVTALRDTKLKKFQALLRETDAFGNARFDPNHWYGAPLYATCLELACAMREGSDYVKALLIAGADPNIPNKLTEKFPIHVACEKGYADVLGNLFRDSKSDPDPNASDRLGNTALHYLAKNSASCKQKKRDSKIQFDGCLNTLLGRKNLLPNRLNSFGKTALQVAIENKNYMAIKIIFREIHDKINVDLKTKSGQNLRALILQRCAEHVDSSSLPPPWNCDSQEAEWEKEQDMRTKLLELLIKEERKRISQGMRCKFEKELQAMKGMSLARIDPQNSLLTYAACNGLLKETQVLLKFASIAEANTSFLPVHVSSRGQWDVLKLLLQPEFISRVDVNATDMKGNSALHYAVQNNDLESVILLLQNGVKCKRFNNVGREAFCEESLRTLLDSCVKTNGAPSHAEEYEIVFDNRLLTATLLRPSRSAHQTRNEPSTSINMNIIKENTTLSNLLPLISQENLGRGIGCPTNCLNMMKESTDDDGDERAHFHSEMAFLSLLVRHSKGVELLKHPITLSFMSLKWRRVKWLTYISALLWSIFLLCLVTHVVLTAGPKEENDKIVINFSIVAFLRNQPFTFWILVPFFVLLVLREFTRIVHYRLERQIKMYFKRAENYLGVAILIAMVVLFLSHMGYIHRLLANLLVILVTCLKVLELMGRSDLFGRNIEMLKVVSRNYVRAFLSFLVILIAFSLSFHLTFRGDGSGRFEDMRSSLLKTLSMTTGEYESNNLMPERTVERTVLFGVFVVGVTILLQNLLIGLAVSDTQRIERDAEALSLRTRVNLVQDAERCFLFALNWISPCVVTRWPWLRTWVASSCLLFWPDSEEKEARVLRNQGGKVELRGAVARPHAADKSFSGSVLTKATRVLGERANGDRDADADVIKRLLEASLSATRNSLGATHDHHDDDEETDS